MSCITDYRNLFGRLAFRGHSERSAGSLSTFTVDAAATQRWQTGWRGAAGPFEVSGTKTTTVGVGAKDVWPRRGDCWGSAPEYDIEPCWGDGRWKDAGRDTWRWERHRDVYLPFGTIVEYETLFVTSYDGGTEYLSFPGIGGYYVAPSSVKSGSAGSWAKLPTGAKRTAPGATSSPRCGGSARSEEPSPQIAFWRPMGLEAVGMTDGSGECR